MKKASFFLLVGAFLCFHIGLQAQSLNLSIPHQVVQQGDVVDVKISTADFDEIESVQFSLNWNPSVIEFQNSSQMDLENVAVGTTDSANGNLRISWFDIAGIGESMEDGNGIINLEFIAIGALGDSTGIEITGDPLAIQIYQNAGENIPSVPLELQKQDGSVLIQMPEVGNPVSIVGEVTNVNCNGGAEGAIDVVLIGDGTYTFAWQGPDDFTSSEPDIQNLTGGDYELQVLDSDGLTVLDTVFSITQPLQALAISEIQADTTDCNKPNGTAVVNVSGGTAPYSYDIGFGSTNQNMMAGLAAGSYSLTVSDANDCFLETSFTIASPTGVTLDLGEDIIICEGEEAFLESPTGESYIWSTGETAAAISINNSGLYSLTVTDAFDCTAVDSLLVEITDGVNLVIENDSLAICPGDSIQLAVSGAQNYTWSDDSGSLNALDIDNPVASPMETITYNLQGTSECGEDNLQVYVEVLETTATAGRDTCVGPGVQLQLNASGGEYYYWTSWDYELTNYNIANPYTTPEDSATYSIMIVDTNGCTIFDDVTVLVGTNPSRFINQVNLITPNGDGKNDNLYFGNIAKYGPNTLKVFNRWGNVVYDRINYQHGDERFDGTYKDKPLPAGTYYYVLSFRDETIKQTLTIVRD